MRFSLYTILGSLIALTAFGEEDCGRGPMPTKITVRHIEGNGFGYNQGYTTGELFYSPQVRATMPFLDLRAHCFNNGKWAFNAGIGGRRLQGNRIYGGNVYWDYRMAHERNYNQIGVGLETLGKHWDFRLNGYLPVGRRGSHFYNTKFAGFNGNNLLLSRKQEYVFSGIDAEAGFHFNRVQSFDFYAALGPYYFEGKGQNIYGGKARLSGRFKEYVALELSSSYDNVFHDIYQAELSLSWPLGPRRSIQNTAGDSCFDSRLMRERMVQPVARDEIIVLDHRHKRVAAIDPMTGKPLHFLFVDNQSHSAGTFESPFPTLLEAMNAASAGDIVYIFPGDGTTKGLSAGNVPYQMLDDMQILGAGLPQVFVTTIGLIKVPAMASGLPNITANPDYSVFNLANNNTFSGLHITADNGIAINRFCLGSDSGSVTDLALTRNVLDALNGAYGILPNEISGSVLISGNTINVNAASGFGEGIDLSVFNARGIFSISDNTINGFGTSLAGIQVGAFDESLVICQIIGNTLDQNKTGIHMETHDTSSLLASMEDNTISNCAVQGIQFNLYDQSNANYLIAANRLTNNHAGISGSSLGDLPAELVAVIEDNMISSNFDNSISLSANLISGSGIGNFIISSNTIDGGGLSFEGISVASGNNASITATIEENSISNSLTTGMGLFSQDDSSASFHVKNNTFAKNPSGSASVNNTGSNTLCLEMTGNLSTTGDAYDLSNSGSGIFDLTSTSEGAANSPQIVVPGGVTIITSPCP